MSEAPGPGQVTNITEQQNFLSSDPTNIRAWTFSQVTKITERQNTFVKLPKYKTSQNYQNRKLFQIVVYNFYCVFYDKEALK